MCFPRHCVNGFKLHVPSHSADPPTILYTPFTHDAPESLSPLGLRPSVCGLVCKRHVFLCLCLLCVCVCVCGWECLVLLHMSSGMNGSHLSPYCLWLTYPSACVSKCPRVYVRLFTGPCMFVCECVCVVVLFVGHSGWHTRLLWALCVCVLTWICNLSSGYQVLSACLLHTHTLCMTPCCR